MSIDWSKAPEWATMHGFVSADSLGIWLNKSQYTYVDGRQCGRTFSFVGREGWGIDQVSCITARAQWQAAVDALKADVAPAWNGAGLPPVGTVCGLWFKGADQGEVTVLFIGDEVGVFKSHAFDHEQHGDLVHYQFYQVSNSQEETDAQDRKKVLAEMTALAGGQYARRDAILQRLYDAGYRKQEQP